MNTQMSQRAAKIAGAWAVTLLMAASLAMLLPHLTRAVVFTVTATTIQNWDGPYTNVELWIFAHPNLIAQDVTLTPAASVNGQPKVVKRVVCTGNASARTLSIPQFEIYSTPDGLASDASSYSAWLMQVSGGSASPIAPFHEILGLKAPQILERPGNGLASIATAKTNDVTGARSNKTLASPTITGTTRAPMNASAAGQTSRTNLLNTVANTHRQVDTFISSATTTPPTSELVTGDQIGEIADGRLSSNVSLFGLSIAHASEVTGNPPVTGPDSGAGAYSASLGADLPSSTVRREILITLPLTGDLNASRSLRMGLSGSDTTNQLLDLNYQTTGFEFKGLAAGINVTTPHSAGKITVQSRGGSESPAGSNTQVQFNDAGRFGGDPGLTYDKDANRLTIDNGSYVANGSATSAQTLSGVNLDGHEEFAWYRGNTVQITNATNANPVVITTSTSHKLLTGDSVTISGVTGNTAANGTFKVTVTDKNTFSLDDAAGNGTYKSGGAFVTRASDLALREANTGGDVLRIINQPFTGYAKSGDYSRLVIPTELVIHNTRADDTRDETTGSLVDMLELRNGSEVYAPNGTGRLAILTGNTSLPGGKHVVMFETENGHDTFLATGIPRLSTPPWWRGEFLPAIRILNGDAASENPSKGHGERGVVLYEPIKNDPNIADDASVPTITNPSTDYGAVDLKARIRATSANEQDLWGLRGYADTTTDSSADLTGVMAGVRGKIRHQGSGGTMSKAADFYAESPTVSSGRTVTDWSAFEVPATPKVSGAITNAHGLLIGAITAGRDNWGIKQTGANPNQLGGVLQIPDGSAASPALEFSNQTNMGFYRVATNQIGVVVNGDGVMRWGAHGPVTNQAYQFESAFGRTPDVEFRRDSAGVIKITDTGNVSKHLKLGHIIGGTSAPAITAGTGAGRAPKVSVAGTDMAGTITVTTGSSAAASATVATITYNAAYGASPYVILTPGNAAAAALNGNARVYVNNAASSAAAFVISSGSVALERDTTYVWNFQVIQ